MAALNNKVKIVALVLIVVAVGIGYFIFINNRSQPRLPTSPDGGIVSIKKGLESPQALDEEGPDIEIVAENLEIPWEIAFLPDGELLITERPGRVLKLGAGRKIIEISGVRHVGEGGLLGLALHPEFSDNKQVYLYLTSSNNGNIVNRVERYKLQGDDLVGREVILEGIDGASNHDGGRIEFGPDGLLYITTGDAQQPSLSQDTSSLNGKILRVTDEGEIPADNPFGNAVYSYGHRNVQGITWDESGNLWATEHGRSGVLSGLDELNLIEKGKNYGWPDFQGDDKGVGIVSPIIHSGASETWAPGDTETLDNSIFFVGLRGSTLYEAKLDGTSVKSLVKHFEDEYGRLRVVRIGPDGYLYIATSNQDGRGRPKEGDDKLIRINPRVFQ